MTRTRLVLTQSTTARQVGLWLLALFSAVSTYASSHLTFETAVRPILKAQCFHCHGEGGERKGDLDLRLRRLMITGGKSGSAIIPGNAEASLLVQKIRSGEMPEGDKKLSPEQINTITQWVAEGAHTAEPEPDNIASGFFITKEERAFWSFQPIRNPDRPLLKNPSVTKTPIDSFVLAQLETNQLTFAPEADRVTLLRRATFNLLGLPPTPEQLQSFLGDTSPGAYGRLIDRLLALPEYGKRWGRHWLDLAGYADSEGYTEQDTVRTDSYKYRDYVIHSFNRDKPYDQFIQEQLAGDEMVKPPYRNLTHDQIEKLVATGFLRMAPDGTGSGAPDQTTARNQVVADTVQIVSSSLLGLTVACAQCHDHRYDPISHEDYYRFRALFEPAFNVHQWRKPVSRRISLYTDADRTKAAEIEKRAVAILNERAEKQKKFIARTVEKQLAKLPKELQEPVRIARATAAKERTEEQQRLLRDHPSVNVSAGSLYLYDSKAAAELKADAAKAASVREEKPKEEFIRALTEVPSKVPATRLFYRGDPEQPKQVVPPGELSVLAENVHIPTNAPALPSTGRRLAYAKHITNGRHPLTARVIVNHIWKHHFGRGLVETPGDFGALGSRPSHPLLLDWLAYDFMNNGWKIKRLHKLIMTSAVYRQDSRNRPDGFETDRENKLYWRMPLKRLEAETLRDSILAVSGTLNLQMDGPPIPVRADEVGQIVIGKPNLDGEGKTGKAVPLHGQEYRQSIYAQVRRSQPLAVLETFDAPVMSPNCDARNSSTVAPQSLMLMNNSFVLDQATHFAKRVIREAGGDIHDQIRLAWQLAYGESIRDEDMKRTQAFLETQTAQFKTNPDGNKTDPALQALASFCQALISSNRFLYVD